MSNSTRIFTVKGIFLFSLYLYLIGIVYGRNTTISTLSHIISCLKNAPLSSTSIEALDHLVLPDENHYQTLLKATAKYRDIPIHSAAGYHGPWIENHFIRTFMGKPLEYFGGMVPLFIQWTDIHVYELATPVDRRNKSIPLYNGGKMFADIARLLRKDIVYAAVSQDDDGLLQLTTLRPNVMSISAGGFGHIAIPLIKGELPYKAPAASMLEGSVGLHNLSSTLSLNRTPPTLVGFYGQPRPRLARHALLQEITAHLKRLSIPVTQHPTDSWSSAVADTTLNLAPRGYGRTSYRLAEIVQIGRVPIYLFTDIPWLPYALSPAAFSTVGISGKQGALRAVALEMAALLSSREQLRAKLEAVKNSRRWFTYDGVLEQLEIFFSTSGSGGLLTCSRHPLSSH